MYNCVLLLLLVLYLSYIYMRTFIEKKYVYHMAVTGIDDPVCIKLKIFSYYWNIFNINT